MEQRLVSPQQLTSILTARRQARGLNQEAVARPLKLSQNRYSELEHDPAKLTLDRLLSIAHTLGLELVIRDAGQQLANASLKSEW
jgi:HTH-type transcriptional regulator/antitoxin HipB